MSDAGRRLTSYAHDGLRFDVRDEGHGNGLGLGGQGLGLVLQGDDGGEIIAEQPRQQRDGKDLRPGEGVIGQRRAFRKADGVGEEQIAPALGMNHMPAVPEVLHIVFRRPDQRR